MNQHLYETFNSSLKLSAFKKPFTEVQILIVFAGVYKCSAIIRIFLK